MNVNAMSVNAMNRAPINVSPMSHASMNSVPINHVLMDKASLNNASISKVPMNTDAPAAVEKLSDGTSPGRAAAKGAKAARDFESMLLGSVFDSLEKTFTWDSDSGPVGSSAYRTLATKALADTVAASGGIGIARLILRNLPVTKAGTSTEE